MTDTRDTGTATHVAGLDKQPHEVAEMFDGVSNRYDLTNTVLSFGRDRRWRRRTRQALELRPGQLVLDVAAGTGVSTAEIADDGVFAVACDFSLGMLRAGKRRKERAGLPFVAGDALALPFADGSFDAVTISFGLRNVHDPRQALSEFARVVKPGGALVVCEFSRPTFGPFRHVYLRYLMRALPWVARRVSSNPDAYVYLADSIRGWPAQDELARTIGGSGWDAVRWRNLTGGIVALHRAVRAHAVDAVAVGAPGPAADDSGRMTMPPIDPDPGATPPIDPEPPTPPAPTPTNPTPGPDPVPSPTPDPGAVPPLAPRPLPGPLGG